ncbi:MAG TPA: hypothetical protein VGK23_02375 [Methanomassiliicoccales archaeon]|jgi:hypothetical protein
MNILLVEPDYYSKYPPLGLLKLASYHRSRGDNVRLVRGTESLTDFNPDIVKVTSLFTYAWKPVHEAIDFFQNEFDDASIEIGGIYASLLPDNIRKEFPKVAIHNGLFEEAEGYLPAYDLLKTVDKWKSWNSSILFTSRGCIRNCPFCVVPRIEGKLRSVAESVRQIIHPDHKRVIIWDNNFLASPDWRKVIDIFEDMGVEVDFNQGLDARLVDEEVAKMLKSTKAKLIRMAYDIPQEKVAVTRAVSLLEDQGFKKRKILFYVLHNFYDETNGNGDTPQDFLERIRYLGDLGCSSYPMRYIPPDSLSKNSYISPYWSSDQLDLVAKARRVIGFGGAFPPYEGLVKKLNDAKSFEEAFTLRPVQQIC